MRKLTALIALAGIFFMAGCLNDGLSQDVQLVASPSTGPPDYRDGGLRVVFAVSVGDIVSIDYGDGNQGTSLIHVYDEVGIYTARATVRYQGSERACDECIAVLNDPPEIYGVFMPGMAVEVLEKVILDARYQEHGCEETAELYGVEKRSWETLTYQWEIEEDNKTVYGEGSVVLWFPLHPNPPPFPALRPVLTADGTWYPKECDDDPEGCEDDPWDDYEPPTDLETTAELTLTVTNQFGSTATYARTIPIYGTGGCH